MTDMSTNNAEPKEFIIEQLEEALEERQTPDRRQADQGFRGEERRKNDRRASGSNQH